jgi:hypothetical protein
MIFLGPFRETPGLYRQYSTTVQFTVPHSAVTLLESEEVQSELLKRSSNEPHQNV